MTHLKLKNDTVSLLSQEILEKTKKGLGFVPNMYSVMSNNTSLLDAYSYSFNSFRENSGFTSVEQEVVFLSAAYENECNYCMAAHSFVGDKMSGVPTEITDAIREGRALPNAKLSALSIFTRLITSTRANVTKEDITTFLDAGYDENAVQGVITGVGVKTFSNYVNHLADTPHDEMFSGRKWNK